MNKSILLIGEACIDVFIRGNCERLSPEAPVVIHKPIESKSNVGMAANVKANILSLSPESKVHYFHQSKEIFKIRYLDASSGQHLLRVDDGDDAFEPDFWTKLIQGMSDNEDEYSALVFSDYGKGLLSEEVMKNLVDISKELGIPSFCDTKKILSDWSKDIDYVKINNKEFNAQLTAGVTEPWKFCKNLIVTRGKNGIDLYNNEGKIIYNSPSKSKDVFSVAGAGDTVLAALVVKLLENKDDINGALDYASKAAAVAVSKLGVVAVTQKEIDEIK